MEDQMIQAKQKYSVYRNSQNQWAVYRYGKMITVCQSKEHALDEAAKEVEAEQWNAANRD